MGSLKINNPPNNGIPLIFHDTKKKECKNIMQPIVKCGLAKDSISSTLYTAVRYGPRYLGGIRLIDPFVIQGTGITAFLIKHYWKSTPSIPLLQSNLVTLQLEAGRGSRVLEND